MNNTYLYEKQNKTERKKIFSAPKSLIIKVKNLKYYEIPKKLSQKLLHKIIKETLILGLREELRYNEKIQKTLKKYLSDLSRLKERVKNNKIKVEENYEKLKNDFHDNFILVDNYEKQINLLNEEKNEIIKTNDAILILKDKAREKLKNQYDTIQEETTNQVKKTNELKDKIKYLEREWAFLDIEFEKKKNEEESKYNALLKEYKILSDKYEYYKNEYNQYEKYPAEKLNDNLNLFDNTKTNDLITEENLKIKLVEKNCIRKKLLNSVKVLHKRIYFFEETQKEIAEKQKKYNEIFKKIHVKFKDKNITKKNIKINKKNIMKMNSSSNSIRNNNTRTNGFTNTNMSTLSNKGYLSLSGRHK